MNLVRAGRRRNDFTDALKHPSPLWGGRCARLERSQVALVRRVGDFSLRLTPPDSVEKADGATLPIKGRDGCPRECEPQTGIPLPCRDAGKRPGFADLTRRIRRGDGAPKSANPMARVPWQDARAPFGAPWRRSIGGRAALSPEIRCFRSSASSWQGPLVVPGGAPAPPECRLCVSRPAGAAPRPASRRLAKAPLKRTR
jgi:hypothetical protein